jgi:hypothetical protein
VNGPILHLKNAEVSESMTDAEAKAMLLKDLAAIG